MVPKKSRVCPVVVVVVVSPQKVFAKIKNRTEYTKNGVVRPRAGMPSTARHQRLMLPVCTLDRVTFALLHTLLGTFETGLGCHVWG